MLRWGKDKKVEKPKETGKFAPPPRQAPPAASSDTARRVPPTPHVAAAPPAPPPPGGVSGGQTLEEVLVEAGTITKQQLAAAVAKQKETGAFLGQILVDLGYIDENSLTSFLAKHCKIPHLSLLDYLIDETQLALIPKEVCLKYRLLPIDKLGKNLTVAMVNPLNQEALSEIRKLCPDLRIKPILCAWHHFEAVTGRLFGEEARKPLSMSATSLGFTAQRVTAPAPEAPPAEPEPSLVEEHPPEPEPVLTIPEEPGPQAPEPVAAEPAISIPESVAEPPAASEEPAPEPIAEPEAEPPPVQEPVVASAPAAAISVPESTVQRADAVSEASFDGDAVLGVVFRETGEESAPAAQPAARPQGPAGSIMQEMISVMRDSMRDTYAMLARRMELFSGLPPEVVARIFSKGMTLEFEAGQTIFNKGDNNEELYVILGGKVDILDGPRHIATLSRGDMFGEMALISNEPRSASAVAVETTSVLALTFDVFEKILPREAAIQLLVNIVITLCERLRAANNFINEHVRPTDA